MILIVRHGPGRGRLPRYIECVFDAIRDFDPALSRALRFHETGAPPPDLAGVRAVTFLLADPLREFYPDCHAEAVALADRARERGIPIVNPPEALSNTIKSVQSDLWRAAGLPTPEHRRIDDADALRAALAEAELPTIIRADRYHGQRNMRLLRKRRLKEDFIRRLSFPVTLAPFVDVRAMHRAAGDHGLYARLHHRKRVFVLGDLSWNDHVFWSFSPMVKESRSTFALWDRVPPPLRAVLPIPKLVRETVADDWEYFQSPLEHPDVWPTAMAALGLQFGAIDYSTLPDGSPILWEANPYFVVPLPGHYVMWRERGMARKIPVTDGYFATFLRRLLERPETIGVR